MIPFIPIILFVRDSYYANAIAYKSNFDAWGISYVLHCIHGSSDWSLDLGHYYYEHGRNVVLGLVLAWSIAARVLGRWDRYEVGAMTAAIFLFFAPGFGVQYTIIGVPLLIAVRPREGAIYSLMAGIFIFVVYWGHWNGRAWPDSQFHGQFPWPSPLWGLAAWASLAWFMGLTIVRPVGRVSRGRALPPEPPIPQGVAAVAV